MLINCLEGLLETEHPYNFVATRATIELLQADGAGEKTIPLVAKLIMPIRSTLISPDKTTFMNGLDSLKALSDIVGHHLTPHISILLA